MADEQHGVVAHYTARLQELASATQHAITQAFREHRETWNARFGYEQARWQWATETRADRADSSMAGVGPSAVPTPPGQALETSRAVQGAIEQTARDRRAREAWLLDPEGRTREQIMHRDAYEVQQARHHAAPQAVRARPGGRTERPPYDER